MSRPADAGAIVQQCLLERGWEVTVSEDGSVDGFAPTGQELQYEADSNECWASAPAQPTFDESPEEYRRQVYDAFVSTRACQLEHGAALPAAPSYEAWTEIKGQWNPSSDLPPDMGNQQVLALERDCPVAYP
ncbi:hypothetical protein [Propioniciclava soli]|uniref:hypothetical protein n=1 Tax=Propioniciclava soli TaxID=2775081 RepID=UPI001E4DF63B|nr:hypothetical protein [Propioniciclava soli]